jgi:hypothetical protein
LNLRLGSQIEDKAQALIDLAHELGAELTCFVSQKLFVQG